MTKVFILTGHTGEYSDRTEWTVRVYRDQEQALAARDLANEYCKETRDGQYYMAWMRGEHLRKFKEGNPVDPDMHLDYTGTEYSVEETELV